MEERCELIREAEEFSINNNNHKNNNASHAGTPLASLPSAFTTVISLPVEVGGWDPGVLIASLRHCPHVQAGPFFADTCL